MLSEEHFASQINERSKPACYYIIKSPLTSKVWGFLASFMVMMENMSRYQEKNVNKKLFEKENDYVDGSKKNPRVCLQQTKWHVQGAEH